MKNRLVVLLLAGLCGTRVFAGQVQLQVNTNTSTVNVRLCVQGTCDDDTAPLRGFITASLDDNGAPTTISLRNYNLEAPEDLNLHLDYGFLGDIFATAHGLRIFHPTPGPVQPSGAIVDNAFTIANLPYLANGMGEYHASGIICGVIQGGGQPCDGVFDLSENGPGTLNSVTGIVQFANGIMSVRIDLEFTSLLDPANPSLGDIRVRATVNASGPVPTGLVPTGADWRFLDDGSDQGIAWSELGFDDSGWRLGPSQLGYGDGDESMVVGFGGDPANKFITTYFRHTFQVGDPFDITNLTLRLLRDDGAIVYLNGAEVVRANMPTGAVNHLTRAAAAVSGAEETVFFSYNINPSDYLQLGPNVLAVELHQSTPDSSDLSFDLQLLANTNYVSLPPTVVITSPVTLTVISNSPVLLQATATDSDGLVTLVEFFEGDVKIGEDSTAPYSLSVPLCAGRYTFTARATDTGGQIGVSAAVNVTVVNGAITLVPHGATWKYRDTGVDQGTAWRTSLFNDAAWPAGRAQLGFGDGDEITTINGGPTTNRYPTVYFRHAFVVSRPQDVLTLAVDLLRDDGGIVYLNGTEVFRNNMPTGAVSFATLTSTNAAGSDETTNFFTGVIDPALLVAGTNVLAVEIHQGALNSSDLSFDLGLRAALANQPPVPVFTMPAPGAVLPAGQAVVLRVSATDSNGTVSRVNFFAGTSFLGTDTTPPFSLLWSNPVSALHVLTAEAVDDCGATGRTTIAINVGTFSMIGTGAVWRFLDDGSDQGNAWLGLAFDDSGWKAGPGQLGYGDGDEATVVDFGVATNKHVTTYFRRTWEVEDPSVITGLSVRLLRDDGAVVYLNGTEVFRSNMPGGPVNFLTLAVNAVADPEEDAYFASPVNPALLRAGANTVEAEIHQVNRMSSDLSFDLELFAATRSFEPRLFCEQNGSQVIVRWPSAAVGFRLESVSSLVPGANWQTVNAPVEDDGSWRRVRFNGPTGARFFRLAAP
jgi:hypothetical protein